jgi:hypothetical protein
MFTHTSYTQAVTWAKRHPDVVCVIDAGQGWVGKLWFSSRWGRMVHESYNPQGMLVI